jgi:hypothetical protein
VNATGNGRWVGAALLVAALYFVTGLGLASLARSAPLPRLRTLWRLSSFLLSACVFAAHVGYEHFGLRRRPRGAAAHAALAVAAGAFALAATAYLRVPGDPAHARSMALALVAWPVLTAVPAFLVAVAAAALLARLRGGH